MTLVHYNQTHFFLEHLQRSQFITAGGFSLANLAMVIACAAEMSGGGDEKGRLVVSGSGGGVDEWRLMVMVKGSGKKGMSDGWWWWWCCWRKNEGEGDAVMVMMSDG
ncbi:hypothetical protein RIF29_21814 [Crotalaria pallida]|uniref:Uncharacterized protein n=1 Tax=Crotalaria pallida TaxID=3830 RepID=A0AAN9F825_CROPI